MTNTTITLPLRRAILRSAGENQANIPIKIIRGVAVAPRTAGESYYYVTPGGKPVYHPNAYRRAWGKPVYMPSTRRVEVGELYLSCLR